MVRYGMPFGPSKCTAPPKDGQQHCLICRCDIESLSKPLRCSTHVNSRFIVLERMGIVCMPFEEVQDASSMIIFNRTKYSNFLRPSVSRVAVAF